MTLHACPSHLSHNMLLQTEVATGRFPYPKWNSVFDQLTQVVQGEPPQLRDNDHRFSQEFRDFANTWWDWGLAENHSDLINGERCVCLNVQNKCCLHLKGQFNLLKRKCDYSEGSRIILLIKLTKLIPPSSLTLDPKLCSGPSHES